MIALNHLQVELTGMNLIEASAGTGKTYAIALLYLRLLVELKLEPKQILVVTFTEAATKELRGRIRRRIREALDVIDGVGTDDALLRDLCANANGRWGEQRETRAALDRALKSFDTAAIFTIHGFCLRALKENVFESGCHYDTELVTDQSGLMREVVDDFWRRSFFNDRAELLGFTLKSGYSVDSLKKFAQGMLGNPKIKIIPECSPALIAGLDADCLRLFSMVQTEWRRGRDEIIELLLNDKGLSKPFKDKLLPAFFTELDSFIAGDNPYELPPDFTMVTATGVANGKKPTGAGLSHPFFDLCEELQQKALQRLRLFCGELIAYGNEQLPLRKQQQNIRFFSDLLNDLYRALCGENGTSFAAKLRATYQAALIDEFQDTDPVQYDIFRRIYADTKLPLFLIGDPKQAIYSFRGADIFAYIQAVMDLQEGSRFTLSSNWRSTPQLLAAFNQLFANERQPFIYEQIEYHPLSAGQETTERLKTAIGDDSAFQIRLMPPDGLNITKAGEIIPQAVAAEIVHLLQEGTAGLATIGGQPLLPADIAVIVRSHRQAAAIRDTLTALNIPCVMRSDMTIFATDEAGEVCTLLQGVLNPGSETSVRAALVTDIIGRSGSEIAALLDDEKGWESCLEDFRGYHQTWNDNGFMVMTRILLEKEQVRGRLLRYPDGERRLTNLLHCFEVIHGRAHELGVGMEGLVTWFSERVSAKEKKEEHEIRLETDERAVKILTIHVSKGLEYPVVFCPYLWTGLIENSEVATFHEGTAMVKDYGSDEFALHKDQAEKEQLAESLRLLYVALTRAKYRCYLYGGKVTSSKSRPETSPLAYLFHASPETRAADNPVGTLADDFKGLSAEKIQAQLQALAADSGGSIHVEQLSEDLVPKPWQPNQDSDRLLDWRKFTATIRNDWRVTSFTSFVSHEPQSVELPDRDESPYKSAASGQGGADSPVGMNIFTFPRGAKAGIFMHAIFEELDFSAASEKAIAEIVAKNLQLHGFDGAWQACICTMVANVISAPLPAVDGFFALADLKKGSWLTELEFFFPLRFVNPAELRASLQGYCLDYQATDLTAVLASLQFKPVRGMVRGFMDMVFEQGGRYYLLDWKSNHLGGRSEDYDQKAMNREMTRNLYPLQYLLYTVALDRYLSLRVVDYDYETHFGGIFYLFLRGVDARQGGQYGIFRDLPPAGLVKSLSERLVDFKGRALL